MPLKPSLCTHNSSSSTTPARTQRRTSSTHTPAPHTHIGPAQTIGSCCCRGVHAHTKHTARKHEQHVTARRWAEAAVVGLRAPAGAPPRPDSVHNQLPAVGLRRHDSTAPGEVGAAAAAAQEAAAAHQPAAAGQEARSRARPSARPPCRAEQRGGRQRLRPAARLPHSPVWGDLCGPGRARLVPGHRQVVQAAGAQGWACLHCSKGADRHSSHGTLLCGSLLCLGLRPDRPQRLAGVQAQDARRLPAHPDGRGVCVAAGAVGQLLGRAAAAPAAGDQCVHHHGCRLHELGTQPGGLGDEGAGSAAGQEGQRRGRAADAAAGSRGQRQGRQVQVVVGGLVTVCC